MACRPGGEDEAGPGPEDGIADRLAGEPVVAGTDRVQAGSDAPEPALERIAFAILLARAILWPDDLRRQRQIPLGRDDGGTEEAVERLDRLIVGSPVACARRAVRAVDWI